MTKKKRYLNIVVSVMLGLIVIILVRIVTTLSSFALSRYIFYRYSFDDLPNVFGQFPYLEIRQVIRLISFFAPMMGGFVVGKRLKIQGALWAGLMIVLLNIGGLCLMLVSMFFSYLMHDSSVAMFPQNYFQRYLLNFPLSFVLSTAMALMGGYFGSYLATKQK